MGRALSGWLVLVFGACLLLGTLACGSSAKSPGMETQCSVGVECDDENPCTENDKCTGQGECVGEPISCDDKRDCTADSCDPTGECVHDLKAGFCLINGVCVADGQAKPDNPCAECMVAASKTEWMNDDTNECGTEDKCHTGSQCTDGECVLGTEALDCDDENPCTDDSCEPAEGCQNVATSSPCEHGTCIDGECECTPDCEGKECGPDGCGSECGTCGEACMCNLPTGTCKGRTCGPCIPDCKGKECGDDGCGGSCGECPGLVCGSTECPQLDGYEVSCNEQLFCEYANSDSSGWKLWDVWLWIPPGSFQMGSPDDEPGHVPAEGPVHKVEFGTGFFISKYEAVVLQYEACVSAGPCSLPSTIDWDGYGWGTNGSANGRSTHPQNGITFEQSKEFCAWVAPWGRLPTEAEWEYTATGPVHQVYPWGNTPEPTCSNDTAVFNEAENPEGSGCGLGGTWEVGSKPVGAAWCGAMDMSGNVREWVQDDYHPDYVGAPADGSAWTAGGIPSPVVRGGNFANAAGALRSAARGSCSYAYQAAYMGVRCARPACEQECDDIECGSGVCGGDCGQCELGSICADGICVECYPSCEGAECGDDGCGGSCGECTGEDVCYLGMCEMAVTLADTGQTACYDAAGKVDCPQSGQPFYGQDANYAGPPLSFLKAGEGTVTDLNTGLVWAKCQGGQTPPNCFGQALKVSWQDAVEHCTQNVDGLPGSGWRLASRNELLSIMHVAEGGCLPSDYFVSIPDAVWTGTEYPFDPQKIAYAISFGTCSAGSGWNKEEQLAYFRCVRGDPLTFGMLVANNDGTVSDLSTGLMWQEKDDGQERSWDQALEYCETLVLAGKVDWRPPNARELMTLMDYTLPNASIYEGFFFGAGTKKYWTGTTLACCTGSAYAVNHVAAIGYCDQKKTLPMNVRCVR